METRTLAIGTFVLWFIMLFTTFGLSIPTIYIMKQLYIPPFLSAAFGVSIISGARITKSRLFIVGILIIVSLACFVYYVVVLFKYEHDPSPQNHNIIVAWIVFSGIFLLTNLIFYFGMIMIYFDRKREDVSLEMEQQTRTSNDLDKMPFVEIYPFESYLSAN